MPLQIILPCHFYIRVGNWLKADTYLPTLLLLENLYHPFDNLFLRRPDQWPPNPSFAVHYRRIPFVMQSSCSVLTAKAEGDGLHGAAFPAGAARYMVRAVTGGLISILFGKKEEGRRR